MTKEAADSIKRFWVELRARDLEIIGKKNFRMTVR
jgi:hypothetical protein